MLQVVARRCLLVSIQLPIELLNLTFDAHEASGNDRLATDLQLVVVLDIFKAVVGRANQFLIEIFLRCLAKNGISFDIIVIAWIATRRSPILFPFQLRFSVIKKRACILSSEIFSIAVFISRKVYLYTLFFLLFRRWWLYNGLHNLHLFLLNNFVD